MRNPVIVTFLTPPPLTSARAAERVAGCVYGLYPVPNIFILYAAAVVREAGQTVRFKDCAMEKTGRRGFENFIRGDDSPVYAFYTVNLAMETDLEALRIIREIRGTVPLVIFFGPCPTAFPEKFCAQNTLVVRGEPEATFRDLARHGFKTGNFAEIAGITYLDGQIRVNPFRPLIEDPDTIPFPARDLLDKSHYFSPKLQKKPFTAALVSRNCPHQCIFCVPSSHSFATELEYRKFNDDRKPPVRKRSPKNVHEEFQLLKKQGYRSVAFQDDQFIGEEDWTVETVRAVGASGVEWGCASRVDRINESVVRAMAQNGCRYIDLGIESFRQEILDDIRKGLKVGAIRPAVDLIQRHGIAAKINILFGASPLESKETIRETIRQVQALGADQVMYNIASPFPGTEFYRRAGAAGWFRFGEYVPLDVQKRSIISYPGLSGETMEKLLRQANRRFFLSPKFILKNLWRLRSLGWAFNSARALFIKLKAK